MQIVAFANSRVTNGLLVAIGGVVALLEAGLFAAPLSLAETEKIRRVAGFVAVACFLLFVMFARPLNRTTGWGYRFLEVLGALWLGQIAGYSFLVSSREGRRLFNSPMAIWEVSPVTNDKLMIATSIIVSAFSLVAIVLGVAEKAAYPRGPSEGEKEEVDGSRGA